MEHVAARHPSGSASESGSVSYSSGWPGTSSRGGLSSVESGLIGSFILASISAPKEKRRGHVHKPSHDLGAVLGQALLGRKEELAFLQKELDASCN